MDGLHGVNPNTRSSSSPPVARTAGNHTVTDVVTLAVAPSNSSQLVMTVTTPSRPLPYVFNFTAVPQGGDGQAARPRTVEEVGDGFMVLRACLPTRRRTRWVEPLVALPLCGPQHPALRQRQAAGRAQGSHRRVGGPVPTTPTRASVGPVWAPGDPLPRYVYNIDDDWCG
jgi:hypothetical protein